MAFNRTGGLTLAVINLIIILLVEYLSCVLVRNDQNGGVFKLADCTLSTFIDSISKKLWANLVVFLVMFGLGGLMYDDITKFVAANQQ